VLGKMKKAPCRAEGLQPPEVGFPASEPPGFIGSDLYLLIRRRNTRNLKPLNPESPTSVID
jgi:hypothetical protein